MSSRNALPHVPVATLITSPLRQRPAAVRLFAGVAGFNMGRARPQSA